LILSDAHERIYSESASTETAELGLYIVRGDNVAMIADYDAELWKKDDENDTTASPLPPILQQRN
jgi:U6 snRNA-associated Sm-like protein LSm8